MSFAERIAANGGPRPISVSYGSRKYQAPRQELGRDPNFGGAISNHKGPILGKLGLPGMLYPRVEIVTNFLMEEEPLFHAVNGLSGDSNVLIRQETPITASQLGVRIADHLNADPNFKVEAGLYIDKDGVECCPDCDPIAIAFALLRNDKTDKVFYLFFDGIRIG